MIFRLMIEKGSEMIFPKKIIILEGILILESEALRNLIDFKSLCRCGK